jgi:hypothetical protein
MSVTCADNHRSRARLAVQLRARRDVTRRAFSREELDGSGKAKVRRLSGPNVRIGAVESTLARIGSPQ